MTVCSYMEVPETAIGRELLDYVSRPVAAFAEAMGIPRPRVRWMTLAPHAAGQAAIEHELDLGGYVSRSSREELWVRIGLSKRETLVVALHELIHLQQLHRGLGPVDDSILEASAARWASELARAWGW